MEDIEQNRGNRGPLTKVMMLVILYILITFSAQFNRHSTHHGLTIAAKIHNPLQELKTSDIAYLYEQEQVYSGTWNYSNPNVEPSTVPLTAQEGNFHFSINRITSANKRQRYILNVVLINGQYLDEGTLEMKIVIDSDNMTSVRPHHNAIALTLKEEASIDAGYLFTKLLVVESEGPIVLNQFNFMFELIN